jgi:hypothetical protein
MKPAAQSALMQALSAALQAHGRGSLDEAELWLDQAARVAASHPDVLHLRGLVALGKLQPGKAVEWIERATRASPRTPMYWNNLGVARRAAGDLDGAAAAHRKALHLKPGYGSAQNNLGAVEAGRGDYEAAARSFETALTLGSADSGTHENLAKALLCLGRFGAAWSSYRLRDPRPGKPPQRRWGRDLGGHTIRVEPEQGIGDQLFFLRFANAVLDRGALLGVCAAAPLQPMLARAGLPPLAATATEAVAMGDLPWLLGCGDDDVPPPLALPVLADRAARVAQTLAPLPRPIIGATWRAGGVKGSQDTVKRVAPEALASVLGMTRGTIVSVQRLPDPGDHAAFAAALGRDVLDLSAWNEDLELMLALMAGLDGYVGVSNANVHLRCGAGLGSDILVPFPMDWRWRTAPDGTVPWYPGSRAYHQQVDGDWSVAFADLERSVRERWA